MKLLDILRKLGLIRENGIFYIGGSDVLPPPLKGSEELLTLQALEQGDEDARQRLVEREKADMKPCYEDVLAEILESGGKLTVYDREDDKDHELTLEKLLNGWKKYAEDHNADDFDEYDGVSADCIMQYAIFGEVIYG